ncbi:hypothetical protein SNEBB_008145 [Seison nebaliae]|nr:hypothetical protein SNEBB_008145 [Seison nebaliae]
MANQVFDSIIEQQRSLHEEINCLEEKIVQESFHKKITNRESIYSKHITKELINISQEKMKELLSLYSDKNDERKVEINQMSMNEGEQFFKDYEKLKDFHKNHPEHSTFKPMEIEYDEWRQSKMRQATKGNLISFSDEEGHGRYFDLHKHYMEYINLKEVVKTDYVNYLRSFDNLYNYPQEKKQQDYINYVERLKYYLEDFLCRIDPIIEVNELKESILKDFEEKWKNKLFPGWENCQNLIENIRKLYPVNTPNTAALIDLSPYETAEELKSLGMDRLKNGLKGLSLKCGGTLDERAKRLFLTKNRDVNDLDKKLLSNDGKDNGLIVENKIEKMKNIAAIEAMIYRYSDMMTAKRANTIENVQRKQARTTADMDYDDEDDDEMDEDEYLNMKTEQIVPIKMNNDDDEDSDDEIVYNPKNLPLGWDGKPIPYWLYKLQGLNLYFNCEICGNYRYRSPKAFQKHFAEWRHAHGMRCLNIPNTAHFANITKISDAVQLWERIRRVKTSTDWRCDEEEEFEDTSGNVINKRIHDISSKQKNYRR